LLRDGKPEPTSSATGDGPAVHLRHNAAPAETTDWPKAATAAPLADQLRALRAAQQDDDARNLLRRAAQQPVAEVA